MTGHRGRGVVRDHRRVAACVRACEEGDAAAATTGREVRRCGGGRPREAPRTAVHRARRHGRPTTARAQGLGPVGLPGPDRRARPADAPVRAALRRGRRPGRGAALEHVAAAGRPRRGGRHRRRPGAVAAARHDGRRRRRAGAGLLGAGPAAAGPGQRAARGPLTAGRRLVRPVAVEREAPAGRAGRSDPPRGGTQPPGPGRGGVGGRPGRTAGGDRAAHRGEPRAAGARPRRGGRPGGSGRPARPVPCPVPARARHRTVGGRLGRPAPPQHPRRHDRGRGGRGPGGWHRCRARGRLRPGPRPAAGCRAGSAGPAGPGPAGPVTERPGLGPGPGRAGQRRGGRVGAARGDRPEPPNRAGRRRRPCGSRARARRDPAGALPAGRDVVHAGERARRRRPPRAGLGRPVHRDGAHRPGRLRRRPAGAGAGRGARRRCRGRPRPGVRADGPGAPAAAARRGPCRGDPVHGVRGGGRDRLDVVHGVPPGPARRGQARRG